MLSYSYDDNLSETAYDLLKGSYEYVFDEMATLQTAWDKMFTDSYELRNTPVKHFRSTHRVS